MTFGRNSGLEEKHHYIDIELLYTVKKPDQHKLYILLYESIQFCYILTTGCH